MYLPKTLVILLVLSQSALQLLAQSSIESPAVLMHKARQEVKILCSDEFAGRGFQHDGHKKAAAHIAGRFQETGLLPVTPSSVPPNSDSEGNSLKDRILPNRSSTVHVPPNSNSEDTLSAYYQPFGFRINLTWNASLALDGKNFEAGKDFIVYRTSGSGSLPDFKVVDCGYALKPKGSLKGKIALFREGLPEKINSRPKKKGQYREQAKLDNKLRLILDQNPAGIIIIQKKLTAAYGYESLPIPVVILLDENIQGKVKTATLQVEAGMAPVTTQNVLGMVKGTEFPDSFLVVTSHYDHLGQLNDAVFAGANDNASGTTMLISMAEYFAKNPARFSILFMAFGAEECGLKGSRFYVEEQPIIPLEKMKFVLNLDLMGNGVDGIMAVCGKDFPTLFEKLEKINGELNAVPVVKARKNAPNSDHYFFVISGVPAFFIYTLGGPKHYHDIYDTAANLQFSKYVEIRELMIRFLQGL